MNKKYLSAMSAVMAGCIVTAGSASAPVAVFADEAVGAYTKDEKAFSVNYNTETRVAVLEAAVGKVRTLTSVIVAPDYVERSTLTSDAMVDGKYIFKAARTDENGNLSLEITIPEDYESGIYNIYLNCGDISLYDDLSYLNSEELADIVSSDINSAKSAAEIEAVIKAEYASFGYDEASAKAYAGVVADGLYAAMPKSGYTADGFKEELLQLTAIAKLKNGEDLETVLKQYSSAFGMVYSDTDGGADFASMTAGAKEAFAEAITDSDVKSAAAEDIFKESIFYAVTATCANYNELRSNVLRYADYLGIDVSEVEALSVNQSTTVFKELYGDNKNGFDSISDFEDKLESEIDNLSSGGSSGGSSSGGSGGSSSVKGGGAFSTDGMAPAAPVAEYAYTDIAAHWGRDIIAALNAKGIISGYTDGSFRPDNSITRAEFAKLLVSVSGKGLTYNKTFTDVNEDDWFFAYISAAAEIGIVNGLSDGSFNPNGLITRQDAAVMIHRLAKFKGYIPEGKKEFADSADIAPYATEAIGALAANAVVDGSDGYFRPLNNTTRAEAAALIYKLLSYVKEV